MGPGHGVSSILFRAKRPFHPVRLDRLMDAWGDHDGTLKATKFVPAAAGTDAVLGPYTAYTWEWSAQGATPPVTMATTLEVFSQRPTARFNTSFPDGVQTYGYGEKIDLTMRKAPNWGTAGSGWPVLRSALPPKTLESVSFLGDGDGAFAVDLETPAMNVEAGAAVGFFNSSGYSLVVSSASSFLSSVISNRKVSPRGLACGVQGAALSLPAGHRTSFVLHADSGVTEAFLSWGDQLLAMHGKPRAAVNSSVSLQYLGYSTTAAYFYAHRKNETYEQTVLAAKAYGEVMSLPYKWILVDSWWYHENAVPGPADSGVCFDGFGGTSWQWDSKPIPPAANCSGNFPDGWRGFAKKLKLPMMLHISEWAGAKVSGKSKKPNPYGASPYAKAAPGDWIVEDACSAPQTQEFWEGIFSDMSFYGGNGGLAVFKQDHGGGEIVQLKAAQRNVSVLENWLGTQGRAAEKHGVTKMLW